MLILNCTKAAAEFFSSTKKGKKISPVEVAPEKTIAESNGGQWQWLVDAVNVKGKKVVVMMEHQTRFSITLSGLKKGDEAAFLNAFELHLSVHVDFLMFSMKIDAKAMDASFKRYSEQHTSRAFYLRGDRSVQSHINDVVWHFRNAAYNQGEVPIEADLIEFDIFLNELLRQRKAEKTYFYPQREFLRSWLRRYGQYSTAQADACIDTLNAEKHAETKQCADILVVLKGSNAPNTPSDTPSLTSEHASLRNNVIELDAYRKK